MRVLLVCCVLVLTACNGAELERLRAENSALEDEVDQLSGRLQYTQDAVEEANDVISEAADDISDAQNYVYGSCADLRYIVEYMTVPEPVDVP